MGVGPGHTACGPYAMSSCTPVQPVDGFDLTDVVRGLLAAGSPLGVTRHGVRGQVDVVLTSATGTYAAWSTGGPWVGPAQVSIAE